MKFALHFMERAGGVPLEKRLADNALIPARIRECESTSTHVTSPTRKAPPTTIALLAAFEGVVVDVDRPAFERTFAWYRCERLWSSMRFDDHLGLVPARIKLLPSGLCGTFVLTKTTGLGNNREELELVVGIAAYIVVPQWLSVGWRLWDGVYPQRDFFSGLPSRDRTTMKCIEARHSDSAAMSLALLGSLRLPSGAAHVRAIGMRILDRALRSCIRHFNCRNHVGYRGFLVGLPGPLVARLFFSAHSDPAFLGSSYLAQGRTFLTFASACAVSG